MSTDKVVLPYDRFHVECVQPPCLRCDADVTCPSPLGHRRPTRHTHHRRLWPTTRQRRHPCRLSRKSQRQIWTCRFRSNPSSANPFRRKSSCPDLTSPSLRSRPARTRSGRHADGNDARRSDKVSKRASNVLKLSEENEKLKQELRAMSERLEAAERRRAELDRRAREKKAAAAAATTTTAAITGSNATAATS